eukprot:3177395-Pyramimonas_sp.AAC.2
MSAFVYGSLLAPEVLHALLGRVPKQSKASLKGYRRYSIKGRPYPGIRPDKPDSIVCGEVLHDLTKDDQNILDEFEDIRAGLYVKTAASVVLQDTDEIFNTDVYVFCSQSDVYGEWDYESFRAEHLEVGLRRAQVASGVAWFVYSNPSRSTLLT